MDPFSNGSDDAGSGAGPEFRAGYDRECDVCDGAIFEGDVIRATGDGGFAHTECTED